MTFCYLDLETYSETPIKHGTFRYAEDSEIMLCAYAFDDGPISVWDATNPQQDFPEDLNDAFYDEKITFVIHNSMFDTSVMKYAWGIDLPDNRIHDTMAQALAHSLPGALATLCDVMGVKAEDAKSSKGRDLVMLFCKPRPDTQKIRRFTRETHPEEWAEFINYAGSDIRAMRSIRNKMPSWNYRDRELDLWRLDRRINFRGFAVDRALAGAAITAVTQTQKTLGDDVYERTDGAVGSATQRDKLLKFILESHGITLSDMQKATLERRLNDENLPPEVKELLAIRLEASMSSTSKYAALMRAVNSDGRLRGTLQFCGASRTGRDAGRTFQPQNLFRPTLKQEEIEEGIKCIKSGKAPLLLSNVMEMAANAIRGCIIAPEGKKLVVSDLSNIEGRFAAWVAEEDWKLEAFRQFDKGIGEDLYKVAYGKAFRVDPRTVGKNKRQIGKVMELMLQYEGGVGAFLTGAATYKIDLDEMAIAALPSIPDRVKLDALGFYEWTLKQKRSTFGLSKETFIVCDSLKRMWREAHPQISSIWKELKEAFTHCIHNPKQDFKVRKLILRKDGTWLRVILPSGRALCYPSPQVDVKGQLSYMGINPYSRKWDRIKTYSGKLFENCLGKETEVLTQYGWQRIVDVDKDAAIWDGCDWVNHEGVIYKGNKIVIDFGGIKITPDHKILINGEWIGAQKTNYEEATSSFARHNEHPQTHAGSVSLCRFRWSAFVLEYSMRLRQKIQYGYKRFFERQAKVLWMFQGAFDRRSQYKAQYVLPSSLCGLEIDAGTLPQQKSQSLEKLRRTRDNRMQKMAKRFSFFLGRYGSVLQNRIDFGSQKQFFRILQEKLSLDFSARSNPQYKVQSSHKHTKRPDAFMASFRDIRNWGDYFVLSVGRWLAFTSPFRRTKTKQQVYDIINCGPRNQFTVRGKDKRPFIVHNCVQAGSRDVFMNSLEPAENAGYATILRVHDELICEVPDNDNFSAEGLSVIMATNPVWAAGLPLAAGGFESKRYRKDG